MSANAEYRELDGGDIRMWINEGGAISLKVVTREGDPVELNEDEADELVEILQRLIAKLRE